MEIRERLTTGIPGHSNDVTPLLYLVVAVSTMLGLAHHLDHLVRGNHVGWPVTPEVNAFTYSLAIYPLIAAGLYLSTTDRPAVGYWASFSAVSVATIAFLHLSPWAVEPPGDVIQPYVDPLLGYVAFGVLLGLIASVSVAAGYAFVLWRRNDDRSSS